MAVKRPVSATVARWMARVFSGMILLFWGWLLAAHMFGDAGRSSRGLTLSDYVMLGSLVTSLAGLVIAWRWEVVGAIMTLLAVTVCAVVNWKLLIFPGMFIPITATLFLLSGLLERVPARTGVA